METDTIIDLIGVVVLICILWTVSGKADDTEKMEDVFADTYKKLHDDRQNLKEQLLKSDERNKSLSFELAESRKSASIGFDTAIKLLKEYRENAALKRELTTVRDHFNHLDKVAHNQRTDLETANNLIAVQSED